MHLFRSMLLGTRNLLVTLAAAGLVATLAAGCAQKRSQPAALSASPKPLPVQASLAAAAPAEAAPAPAKEKQSRFGESVVYVDGRPVGVLRATELPLGLKGRVVDVGGGYTGTLYGFIDYVRALGVDSKKIRAIHVYGGARVSVVDHAALSRWGDRLAFAFVRGDRGKPHVDWPPVKLGINTTVDMISNVAVYVDKEPPVLRNRELVMPDGTAIAGKVPYAPEEQGNGTRVYVDGTLVGTVKRKKITNDMLSTAAETTKAKSEASNEDRFSLLAYAAKLRADANKVKSIDLVSGDDVLAHVAAEGARALTFNVPAHNRGQAMVDVPSADGTHRARVTAVQIYVNVPPPARPVVNVDAAQDAQPGSGQGGSSDGDEL